MIVRQRTHWFKMLLAWQGSVLPKILPQLLILACFSIAVLFSRGRIYEYKVNLNPTIFTLIGIALAIFLGFCNTASYDRYWEGRKLWGTLVVESRSLIRQVLTWIGDDQENRTAGEKKLFIKRTAALGWALNYQLRQKTETRQLDRLLEKEEVDDLKDQDFIPGALLLRLGEQISAWTRAGEIDSITAVSLNQQLNNLSAVVGGCERILNTPLPFTYHVLLHRTVYIYCFLLPFGLVDVTGWVTPLLVVFISYTFISLDAIVNEIGEPFGEEANDLALNSICWTIEHSIFELAKIPRFPSTQSGTYFLD